MLHSWAAFYVGIPFKSHGRGHEGCDCYGLVRLVLAEVFGRSLPDLAGDYDDTQDHEQVAGVVDYYRPLLRGRPVDEPAPGDVAVLRIKGWPAHLGVYAGDGKVLHVDRSVGTVIERLDAGRLKGRLEGYYRVD